MIIYGMMMNKILDKIIRQQIMVPVMICNNRAFSFEIANSSRQIISTGICTKVLCEVNIRLENE